MQDLNVVKEIPPTGSLKLFLDCCHSGIGLGEFHAASVVYSST